MPHTIHHDAEQGQFSAIAQDHLCVLEYELNDAVMTITHTRVPSAVGGQGIAADLTRTALETARQNQWRVVPECSYAAIYIKRHPAFADLVV